MKKKKRQGQYRQCWNYIKESRKYIWFVISIFILFAIFAVVFPVPDLIAEKINQVIKELINLTQELNTIELIGFIFFNNLRASFFGIIFGVVIGVIPFLITISNGYVLGFVSKAVVSEVGFLEIWRLLPHGIFELPAVFISLALGIRWGMFLFAKNPGKEFKTRFFEAIRVFFFIIIPLLIIAAIIEGILIRVLG
jgi:stage II sporulation protein M